MTEREKMLNGMLYNSRDEELLGMYHRAKALVKDFENASSENAEEKFNILSKLFCKFGVGSWVEGGLKCDYGQHIYIGENTFINYNCVLLDDNIITIGSNCLIATNVQFLTAIHPLACDARIVKKEDGTTGYTTYTKPVSIGNNVWVGGGAIICPGVTIGDNCVIGAGSVVTKNVKSGMLAYGNPCREIRAV